MNENYELVKEIVSEQKYKVLEDDGESIVVRRQMNSIHICPNADEDKFVALALPNFAEVNEDNMGDVIMKCHHLNRQMKQVKFYTINDVIIVAYEFYYQNKEDCAFQIKQGLTSLIAAKVSYHKLND